MDASLPRGTRLTRLALTLVLLAIASGCPDDPPPMTADAGGDCPPFEMPLAMPGDPIDGDDWDSFAQPLFESYCTRCHHSSLAPGEMRQFATPGIDFDDRSSVRANAPLVRNAVGVFPFMPPDDPLPSCDERRRLVRWIDADLPGL